MIVDIRIKGVWIKADILGIEVEYNYTVYTALLTQTSTNAPTATILGTNSLGAIVWTRTGLGTYVGTLSGAFDVYFWCTPIWSRSNNDGEIIHLYKTSVNTVQIDTYNDSGSPADGVLNNTPIEIRVYQTAI